MRVYSTLSADNAPPYACEMPLFFFLSRLRFVRVPHYVLTGIDNNYLAVATRHNFLWYIVTFNLVWEKNNVPQNLGCGPLSSFSFPSFPELGRRPGIPSLRRLVPTHDTTEGHPLLTVRVPGGSCLVANGGMRGEGEAVAVPGAATCAVANVRCRLWQMGTGRAPDSLGQDPHAQMNKRRERAAQASGQLRNQLGEGSHRSGRRVRDGEEDETWSYNLRPMHVLCDQSRSKLAAQRHHQRS